MTAILCKWLNEDVHLEREITSDNFEAEFANGYLIGQVLNKYSLQSDFGSFSKGSTSESKLNNFMLIEPTLALLDIPFNTATAKDIMYKKHGVAVRLLYELYIALNNKEKRKLTGTAMQTMKARANVALASVGSIEFKRRLTGETTRQSSLNLREIENRYNDKKKQLQDQAFKKKFLEEEQWRQEKEQQRQQELAKFRNLRQQQTEVLSRIRAAAVRIPKPPSTKKANGMSPVEMRKTQDETVVKEEIEKFENSIRNVAMPSSPLLVDFDVDMMLNDDGKPKNKLDPINIVQPNEATEYVTGIKRRVKDDLNAKEERQKRRRRVLLEQMKAYHMQEEAHHEDILVNRLMRQSQHERKIAVQLMHERHLKEVIVNNRIERENEYTQRRLKDFDDALNREAKYAELARLQYQEELKKEKALHQQILNERAERKYQKHYSMCMEIMNQIVDFSVRIGQYRELTENKLPSKLLSEWKTLFTVGIPLFDDQPEAEEDDKAEEADVTNILHEERQALLDEADFMEYNNGVGEWNPPENFDYQFPPKDNSILGHIVKTLFNTVAPPEPPVDAPEFPEFPIKACFLGKQFSGKSVTIDRLLENHRIKVIELDNLIHEAVDAFERGELDESKIQSETNEDEGALGENEMKKDNESSTNLNTTGQGSEQEGDGSKTTMQSSTSLSGIPNEDSKSKGGNLKHSGGSTYIGKAAKQSYDGSNGHLGPVQETEHKPSNDGKRRGSIMSFRASDIENYSPRAKLGFKAAKALKRGKAVDDQVMVDIITNTIKKIPQGSGWILDDFPSTYNQAKLFEKALTGYDPSPPQVKTISQAKGGSKARKKSLLAPDPKPEEKLPPPVSGIDVVILFDVKDEVVLKRATGRTKTMTSSKQYHEEFNPPPEGSRTGLNKQDKVMPVSDANYASEHVQQRLVGFHDTWSKLEKWFTKFGNLKKIDGAEDQETVFQNVETILEEVLEKLKPEPEPEPSSGVAERSLSPQQPLDLNLHPVQDASLIPENKDTPLAETPKVVVDTPNLIAVIENESKAQTEKEKNKHHPIKSEDSKDVSPRIKEKGKKFKKKSDARRRSSAMAEPVIQEQSLVRQGEAEDLNKVEEEEERPPSPPKPEPGSEDWIYVENTIELELATILSSQWENIEINYIDSCKYIFRKMRDERESTYQYFYNIRNEYKEFLRRPDLKQMLVNQWQKEYNDLAEDMRSDEETKAELHQTVMDLAEKLWNMCDKRKEDAERERDNIMKDGWLEDRVGLTTNYYITLMQAELDRVQDTCFLLKDYYMSAAGKILIEFAVPNGRLPLLELATVESSSVVVLKGTIETNSVSVQSSTGKSTSAKESVVKESRGKDRGKDRDRERDKDKEKEKDAAERGISALTSAMNHEDTEDGKTKIPLIPRRPKSAEQSKDGQSGSKEKREKKSKKEKQEEKVDSPSLHMDPDEKVINDAYNIVQEYVLMMISAELTATAAEAEKEREREHERQRDLEKAAKTKKKHKKEKVVKGRHKKQQIVVEEPVEEPPEQTAEEKEQIAIREKIREEFTAATKAEEIRLRSRLELIRSRAICDIQVIKHKAEVMYKDMDDWLGQRFRKEMESIKELTTMMRAAIESEEKIQNELKLVNDNFFIDENVMMYNIPEPPPPPSPIESSMPENFTVVQILNLAHQLSAIASNGYISKQAFIDLLHGTISLSHGQETLPDKWMLLNQTQLNDMANLVSLDKEYINWRIFLVAIMNPVPWPSRDQLLDTLKKFRQVDTDHTGFVTKAQYEKIELWFKGSPPSNQSPSLPRQYDRLGKLKEAFFDIFGHNNTSTLLLDYVDMLLYFCQARRHDIGLMRALSVTSSQPMPYISIRELTDDGLKTENEEKSTESSLHTVIEEKEEEEESESATHNNAMIPVEALVKVLNHGTYFKKKSNRFELSTTDNCTLTTSYVSDLYQELGSSTASPLPFDTIFSHPILHNAIKACKTYKKAVANSL
ncbi:uncharacterized protein TRIADDRAFT_58131 [Trichoplax adhaerens]|uniref:Calponin-homology (CH) domain-containing protein n=1 Tax=Trichoplax adhaerens TaxID=10228 RepID=B3S0Y6_TRIAD|nr:hypothetical protein TRIADDRAFT_58131 [Trichoplax adhaerens]EDV23473.1 hypothetical protein TRIADDRAFT_58131 [Trichoplax adhaerens]|eukprot:XP_002114383.1 hypothetical protein TRIADDRAFT_58131 [Trichoplax adhaerens]